MKIEMSKAEEAEARLTAYALGELDAEETRSVEALLKESEESRASLEEIQSTVALLTAEFSKEPKLSLREEQVEAITSGGKIVRGTFFSRHSNVISLGAVAACACLFAAAGMKQYLAGLEAGDVAEMAERAGERDAAEKLPGAAGGAADKYADRRRQSGARKMPSTEFGKIDGEVAKNLTADQRADVAAGAGAFDPPEDRSAGPQLAAKLQPDDASRALKQERKEEAGAAGDPPVDRDRLKGLALRTEADLDHKAKRAAKKPSPGGDGAMARPKKEAEVAVAETVEEKSAEPPTTRMEVPAESAPQAGSKTAPSKPASRSAVPKMTREAQDRIGKAALRRAFRVEQDATPDSEPSRKRAKDPSAAKVPESKPQEPADEAGEGKGDDDLEDEAEESKERRANKEKRGAPQGGGELVDNPWVSAWADGKSTFAIDVDTGTYPLVRRYLTEQKQLPPGDSVRVEEMINYFKYDYPEPEAPAPFSVNMEMAGCPWNADHRLLRVGLKGRGLNKRPPSNLMFLVDVSGSMRGNKCLPLLKESMKAMVSQLNEDDWVGIVTYATDTKVVLKPTSGDQKELIYKTLDGLSAGGSTNGGSGIELSYSLARQQENFVEGGTNRVILATDGDFNRGMTDTGDLNRLIERSAAQKVFLTVLGFGQVNLKDKRLEQLADKGNGTYHYIDKLEEGKKVLVEGIGGTLVTVAKDVKVQVEFNPAKVARYRLLGYANRMLPDQAFDDPAADAGEIGAGHTVTAIYEIEPAVEGAEIADSAAEDSRYREAGALRPSNETLVLNLNYKRPEDNQLGPKITIPLVDPGKPWSEASEDFRFASTVAGFGMVLRDSDYAGQLNYDLLLELGNEGIPEGGDTSGRRSEFLDLVKLAKKYSAAKE